MLPVQAAFAIDDGVTLFVFFVLIVVLVMGPVVVAACNPRVAVVQRCVLARQIQALGAGLDVIPTPRGKSPSTRRQARRDGSLFGDPVGEGILTILNDGLASLVSVVSGAGLAGGDGGVVDQFQKVLAVSCDDGDLFTVFAKSVELVRIGRLDLLARYVGKLCFGD